ncbi:hypothetical protein [Cyanobium sp. ATX-6F1]|uniref:hypothetical protein n=1 Tax=Cyanobium sp. ATX-6F1 TaxID=3137388 RepID=UPI0039BE5527
MSGISLYVCFNQVNYLAAWRQRLLERPRDLSLLLVEPSRVRPDASKPWPRGIAHLRGPSGPWTMAVLVLLALLGLIERIYIPHRREAGRGLGFVLSRCRHIHLLDDGLDQYRGQPRALITGQFPLGTPSTSSPTRCRFVPPGAPVSPAGSWGAFRCLPAIPAVRPFWPLASGRPAWWWMPQASIGCRRWRPTCRRRGWCWPIRLPVNAAGQRPPRRRPPQRPLPLLDQGRTPIGWCSTSLDRC